MEKEQSEFLKVGLRAVKEAEKILLKYFDEGDLGERTKADNTPVTKADVESQKVIIDTIRNSFPDHKFLGEEDTEKVDLSKEEFIWIVDPIDGTKNYIRKNPLFGTLVGLMHNGEMILGISNSPVLGELMYAEKGAGAYLNGQLVRVSPINQVSEAALSFGGLKYFDKLNKIDNLVKLSKDAKGARGIGDSWSFHLVAQGKIDIMVDAQTFIWDIAALSLIIEEAGGKVTDISGNPLNLSSTSAIATNGLIHDEIKSYFI